MRTLTPDDVRVATGNAPWVDHERIAHDAELDAWRRKFDRSDDPTVTHDPDEETA